MQLMKTVKVEKNQTIYDIAVQEFGNVEAVFEILQDNSLLEIDITESLLVNSLLIREDSIYQNQKVLNELEDKTILNQ